MKASPERGSAVRALVVDDSRAMRRILRRILEGLGFGVQEAANGREALDRLHAGERADLVLIDWNMPEMNGIEFVRAVRAEERFAPVALVMVTTETELERIAAALDAGVNEYVMKPFTPEVIQEKLALLGIAGRTG